GLSTPGMDLEGFAKLSDIGRHFILPVIALSTFYTAIYGRLSRAAMLEVLSQDFIRTARAKGVPERGLLWRHALRNALMPIVTMAGLQVSSLLGGAVLIETVFGLPGIGRTAFDAVMERDTNMLLGVLFMSSLGVVCVNLLVDLLYRLVDPRVELA
uniref:ABC transporter permease n=1 Tax=Bosea sp. (in: a-proteobacteria) TaxID=1871050 RepID=UPI00333FF736